MALSDTLASFTSAAPATKNRVDILLEKLFADGADEDFTTLTLALNNPLIPGAALTRALRVEYGPVVTDTSVDAWRRKNAAEVNGL